MVISSFTLTRVEDQCVSYHCMVDILRNGGSARSPCAAAVPGVIAAAMLSARINDSAGTLTAEDFRANLFECILLTAFRFELDGACDDDQQSYMRFIQLN